MPVGAYAINEKNFPDSVFREFVSKNYDKDSDGILSKNELSSVTNMELTENGIKSLKGIELFGNLESLSANGLTNTSIEITDSSLKFFNWWDGKLKKLDVSGLPNITQVIVESNSLTSLVIGNKPSIEAIVCSDNKLTTLDVRGCANLKVLEAANNKLTSIDLSKNKNLEMLDLAKNNLKHVDLTYNTAITSLSLDKGITVTAKGGGYIEKYAKSNNDEFVSASVISLYKTDSRGYKGDYASSFEKWSDAINYINKNTTSDGYMITLNDNILINGKLALPKKGACKKLIISGSTAGNSGRKQLYVTKGDAIYPECDLELKNINLARSVESGGKKYFGYIKKISSGGNRLAFNNCVLNYISEIRSNTDMYFVDTDITAEIIAKDHVIFRGVNNLGRDVSAKGLVFEGNCELLFRYNAEICRTIKVGKDGIRYDKPANFFFAGTDATVDKYVKCKSAGNFTEIALTPFNTGYTTIVWDGILPFESSAFNIIDNSGKTSKYQFALLRTTNSGNKGCVVNTENDKCAVKFTSGASVIDGKVMWYDDKEKEVTVYISGDGLAFDTLSYVMKKYHDTVVSAPTGVVDSYGVQYGKKCRFRECEFKISFTGSK